MAYASARTFLKYVQPRRIRGVEGYTLSSVMEGMGLDHATVAGWIKEGLDRKLGFEFVEMKFNLHKLFPRDAIPLLYAYVQKCESATVSTDRA